jgi:bifunctional DNA-binding transcriptional regulator/antitoxin component of YhaV-PrlF toxin-antitoxin module
MATKYRTRTARQELKPVGTITCTAKVQPDGSLALPQEAREQLALHPGDQVQVQVHTTKAEREQPARNPLYDIIGIATGGPADGAENHDAHLYGKEPE